MRPAVPSVWTFDMLSSRSDMQTEAEAYVAEELSNDVLRICL